MLLIFAELFLERPTSPNLVIELVLALAVARVIVNAIVRVFLVASLTCPEMAVCVTGNAAAVYSYPIDARLISGVHHVYLSV